MPRNGDLRPHYREPDVRLTWHPMIGAPIRWLPRHGDPYCRLEWLSQKAIRGMAYLPIYTAVIATATLILIWVTR